MKFLPSFKYLVRHEKIKPFKCNEEGCGKAFGKSTSLNKHMKFYHIEKIKKHLCDKCDYR